MLLSQLAHEIDDAVGRFGEIVVAIGAINGAWRSFSGLRLGKAQEEAFAVLSAGDVAYFRAPQVSSADLRKMIEGFIGDHGDMAVAVADHGMLHTLVDLNVDTDVDETGEDVSVMIVQAYVVKAYPKLAP